MRFEKILLFYAGAGPRAPFFRDLVAWTEWIFYAAYRRHVRIRELIAQAR